jgi:hypothetical protein
MLVNQVILLMVNKIIHMLEDMSLKHQNFQTNIP